ncbi:MAG: biopolymer transporter ExbD [Gammaproteobacteria bacterium]|jgi:biopolymer transport protein ExbD|nr:biopolymer transporter ExbD [Gammaproteobacteria bacterium]
MKKRLRDEEEAEINITPMLDIVFIMLIFFIVTTSFVKEKGLEIARPTQSEQQKVDQENLPIVVKIDHLSNISINGREVDQAAMRANLERENALKPKAPLIVAAHPDAETHALVAVLDAANIVGIEGVSVATTNQ